MPRAVKVERRSYQQFCGVARALDVVGERWTLLVVRNLLLGPRRYSDFLAELPGLTTNLLAKRLQDLEAAGLVAKRAGVGVVTYALTERGAALEPVVLELGRWGGALLDKPRRGDRVDIALGLLALKRRYRGGLSLTLSIVAGGRPFTLLAAPEALVVRDQPAQRPDLTVAGPELAFRALFFRGADAAALRASGELVVTGDEGDWARWCEALGVVNGATRAETS